MLWLDRWPEKGGMRRVLAAEVLAAHGVFHLLGHVRAEDGEEPVDEADHQHDLEREPGEGGADQRGRGVGAEEEEDAKRLEVGLFALSVLFTRQS